MVRICVWSTAQTSTTSSCTTNIHGNAPKINTPIRLEDCGDPNFFNHHITLQYTSGNKAIQSGDTIIPTTDASIAHPLPKTAFVEMQWVINRITTLQYLVWRRGWTRKDMSNEPPIMKLLLFLGNSVLFATARHEENFWRLHNIQKVTRYYIIPNMDHREVPEKSIQMGLSPLIISRKHDPCSLLSTVIDQTSNYAMSKMVPEASMKGIEAYVILG